MNVLTLGRSREGGIGLEAHVRISPVGSGHAREKERVHIGYALLRDLMNEILTYFFE